MRFTMGMTGGRRLAGSLALGAVLLGSTSMAAATAPTATTRPATTPTWVTTTGKVVHLTVIAAWNNANAGFNFDGAAHGQMVVTVPLGDKVVATFKNNGQGTPHDAVIIPYTLPLPGSSTRPAFSGAASPTPRFGAGGSPSTASKAQTFSFTAGKAGKYLLVCGIAGHALAGMWDLFVVSPTARVASVTFTKTGIAGTTGTTTPPAKAATWATTTGKTVHLSLIAGWNNANAGFNFDGAANGQMVVTVPLGDKVVGTFKNAATTPHDVRIINYQKPLPAHTVALAFPGASAGGPTGGSGGKGGPPKGTPGPGGAPQSSNKPQTMGRGSGPRSGCKPMPWSRRPVIPACWSPGPTMPSGAPATASTGRVPAPACAATPSLPSRRHRETTPCSPAPRMARSMRTTRLATARGDA